MSNPPTRAPEPTMFDFGDEVLYRGEAARVRQRVPDGYLVTVGDSTRLVFAKASEVTPRAPKGMTAPIPERRIPWLLRLAGARWRDGHRTYRMSWGEVAFGRPGWALNLHLFSDRPHFSLQIHVWRVANVYVSLPFLRRFAREPEEMMESWGASYDAEMGYVSFRWAARYKMFTMPWRNWRQVSHDVLREDGSWVPFVGSWERDKEPDGRQTETHPYHYLLRSGEKQDRTATLFVERRIHRLSALRWASRFQRVAHWIDVEFSDEVGERSGSWKGGTIGCSYELRPNETPRECLRRMEQERKFS